MEPDKGKSTFDEIEKWLSTDYSWTRLYFDDPYETVLEMLPSFTQNLVFFYKVSMKIGPWNLVPVYYNICANRRLRSVCKVLS